MGRFFWWIANDPTAPAVFIQAFASVVMMVTTIVLARTTYKYMELTRKLANTALEQLKASVRPEVEISLDFGGGRSSTGAVVFKDTVSITINNTGSGALLITKVTIGWQDSNTGDPGHMEARAFRGAVITSKGKRTETTTLSNNGKELVVDPQYLEMWKDMLAITVECSDVGGLAPISYVYQQCDGVSIV